MEHYYFDTETIGFHGLILTIQYTTDSMNNPVLYMPWEHKLSETKELLLEIANNCAIGFNLVFDWFHVYKLYTLIETLPGNDKLIEYDLETITQAEKESRDYHLCLKPMASFDLLLQLQKSKYQYIMPRKPIRVNKVPVQIAPLVVEELNKIPLDDILFYKKKEIEKFKILKSPDENFVDIVLNFAPSNIFSQSSFSI
jgi:hypothetical protein